LGKDVFHYLLQKTGRRFGRAGESSNHQGDRGKGATWGNKNLTGKIVHKEKGRNFLRRGILRKQTFLLHPKGGGALSDINDSNKKSGMESGPWQLPLTRGKKSLGQFVIKRKEGQEKRNS